MEDDFSRERVRGEIGRLTSIGDAVLLTTRNGLLRAFVPEG